MDRILLVATVINPAALLADFTRARGQSGAVVSFTGLVRADRGPSTQLELEAYPGFTEARIGEFADAAIARFSLDDLLIHHRVGAIAARQPVVFVAAAAAHRRQAFGAVDYLMDYLKSAAPFWKKEIWQGGSAWIEPKASDGQDLARWSGGADDKPESNL